MVGGGGGGGGQVVVKNQMVPYQTRLCFHDCKNDIVQMKKIDVFSYFCAKHRLWVLVVYPCKPQFYYMIWGVRGYTVHGHVIMMFLVRIHVNLAGL